MMSLGLSTCSSFDIVSRVIFICLLSLSMSGDAYRSMDSMLFFSSIFSSSSLPSPLFSSFSRHPANQPFKLYSSVNQGLPIQPFNPFVARDRNSNNDWLDDKNLEAYYEFISQQPLLTDKQEYQLGRAIQFWNRLENVRESLRQRLHGTNATAINDSELAIYIGCKAEEIGKMRKYSEISKRRLLLSNLKLVMAVVSRYRSATISNAELIANGVFGLSQAVLRYDYSRGFRFATYATWYIHQAVSYFVQARKANITLPNRELALLRKMKQFISAISKTSTRKPSIGEIAEALSIPRFQVMKILSCRRTPTRINQPITGQSTDQDGDKVKTLDMIIPSFTTEPTESFAIESIKSYVEALLQDNMTQVEMDVLRARLGLEEGREVRLKEIGKKYKLSWMKIRKLEEEALGKLQSMDLDPLDTAMQLFSYQQSLRSGSTKTKSHSF